MEILEQIVAEGTGKWDVPYQLILVNSNSTYFAKQSSVQKVIAVFKLKFKPINKVEWDLRTFQNENERKLFVNNNFSDLNLDYYESHNPISLLHPLSYLIGEELNSIVFIMDYLQITFNDEALTFYTWPKLVIGNETITIENLNYRNSLCSLIGKVVQGVDEFCDVGVNLTFDNNSILEFDYESLE